MADSDKLSLGLDDIIQKDRSNNRRGGGGNRGSRGRFGRGGGNTFRNRGGGGGGGPRVTSAPAAGRWRHDLYETSGNPNRGGLQRNAGVNSTTKLLISNLEFNVTTDDIQELFDDVGAVRTARVHYDESGQSLGTAEVVYERRVDAIAAQKKYNTLNLDGRPMDIRMVGGTDDGSRPQSGRFSQANGNAGRNQRFGNRNNDQQNGFRGNQSRGGRGDGGRQRQNGAGNKKEGITTDDLDADLDAYRAESKQKKQ